MDLNSILLLLETLNTFSLPGIHGSEAFNLEASRSADTKVQGGRQSHRTPKIRPVQAAEEVSSVIVRVLGRRFSYRVICSKIAFLWTPQGGFQVINLDNDYFLVRFEKREDYSNALSEVPWLIQGSYLTVQTWVPGFDVQTVPTKATVWVQIAKMPVEWYKQDVLSTLSAQIGKPIRIDINTLEAERGKFARLAIEVEFSKPLVGWVEIEGRWFKVKYEDIPDFCFTCGVIGHVQEHCPGKQCVQSSGPNNPVVPSSDQEHVPAVNLPTSTNQAPELTSKVLSSSGTETKSKDAGESPISILQAPLGPLVFKSTMNPASNLEADSKGKKDTVSSKGASMGRKSRTVFMDIEMESPLKKKAVFPGVDSEMVTCTFTYPKGAHAHASTMTQDNGTDTDSVENMHLGGLIFEAGLPKQQRKANAPLEDASLPFDPNKGPPGAKSELFASALNGIVQQHRVKLAIILEPRISGRRARNVIRGLGFRSWIVEDDRGFSGGIWILWRPEVLSVAVLDSAHVRLSWIVMGDFNVISSPDETQGGQVPPQARKARFRQWIEECGLSDLGFKGPRFTWFRGNLWRRLDRVLVMDDWRQVLRMLSLFIFQELNLITVLYLSGREDWTRNNRCIGLPDFKQHG
ncbi:hypothetical protein Tsubulata_002208 [Turnera subulata]|uniref:CCHC-type domain-containing protein n=1 Tax=Turnera subulata TaxID=218843 RepID=A0A9Q0F9I6_9ROSI|nr:hypothetical protein Tsubulata_002208 [Turnera subulata]